MRLSISLRPRPRGGAADKGVVSRPSPLVTAEAGGGVVPLQEIGRAAVKQRQHPALQIGRFHFLAPDRGSRRGRLDGQRCRAVVDQRLGRQDFTLAQPGCHTAHQRSFEAYRGGQETGGRCGQSIVIQEFSQQGHRGCGRIPHQRYQNIQFRHLGNRRCCPSMPFWSCCSRDCTVSSFLCASSASTSAIANSCGDNRPLNSEKAPTGSTQDVLSKAAQSAAAVSTEQAVWPSIQRGAWSRTAP